MAAVFEPACHGDFSLGGYRYPNRADLLVLLRITEHIYLWEYKICREPQPSPMTGQLDTVSMMQRQDSVRMGEGQQWGAGSFRSGGF
jgi:hypothetical protein